MENLNFCACMGPIGNDPYCPCEMRRRGFEPSGPKWTDAEKPSMAPMTERPIIFKAHDIRAILDGRKTQTRQVVKPQPTQCSSGKFNWSNSGRSIAGASIADIAEFAKCPFGQPGDRLWGREKHFINDYRGARVPEDERADTELVYAATDMDYVRNLEDDEGFAWRPSIHMPRWASRITLEVTGVRVERLQDISEDDAIDEGLHRIEIGSGYRTLYSATPATWAQVMEQEADAYDDPRAAYRELWEQVNGTGSWDANPWVWVIAFKRVEVE